MPKISIDQRDYDAQLALICSADDAAKLLGVSAERVNQFCREGRLAATRIGRDWIICRAAAEHFAAIPRPPGPRKKS